MLELLATAVEEKTSSTEASFILEKLGYRPYEIRRIKRSRIKLVNDFLTYLFGNIRYVLTPIQFFEKRDYSVVLYLPEDITSRMVSPTS